MTVAITVDPSFSPERCSRIARKGATDTPDQVATWIKGAAESVQARLRERFATEDAHARERECRVINGHAVTVEATTCERRGRVTASYRLTVEVEGLRVPVDHALRLTAVHADHLHLIPAGTDVPVFRLAWVADEGGSQVMLGQIFGAGNRWLAEDCGGVVVCPRTLGAGLDLPPDFPSARAARNALLLHALLKGRVNTKGAYRAKEVA